MKRIAVLLLLALSANAAPSDHEIAQLRARGQAAVDELANDAARLTNRQDIEQARLVLDRVCAQRDCYASRLYWFTDLDAAKAEARKRGKAILSLRLLGHLDDDLSCANSRFFRTILYSDPRIAAAMRENFVLHWSSERPVPQVTIDFGDGRKLRQTVAGNSIHYLLDADGRPLDALPGLYSPDAFLEKLNAFAALATKAREHPEILRAYHRQSVRSIDTALRLALQDAPAAPPTAQKAAINIAPRAMTKAMLEIPLLEQLGQQVADEQWDRIAELRASDVRFAPETIALMKEEYGATDEMIAKLRHTVAEDTARNELNLHAQLHAWLAQQQLSFDALNTKVYAELFLTPRTDPWLGLQPAGFSALR